ncbi:MAG: helix-turn-helix transcriptional regulator [Pseudomonadota bacterium]
MKLLILRSLLVVQILTAFVFLVRFWGEVFGIQALEVSWTVHEFIELGTIVSLIIGSTCAFYVLSTLVQRNTDIEDQLKLVAGDFAAVMNSKFNQWALSDAEQEVAVLSLKGFSVSDVAKMRGKSIGTIKAQNAAVYRKAGVSGRAQLMASLMEDLLDRAVVETLESGRTATPEVASSNAQNEISDARMN